MVENNKMPKDALQNNVNSQLTDNVEPRSGLLASEVVIDGDSVESCVLLRHLGDLEGADLISFLHLIAAALE